MLFLRPPEGRRTTSDPGAGRKINFFADTAGIAQLGPSHNAWGISAVCLIAEVGCQVYPEQGGGKLPGGSITMSRKNLKLSLMASVFVAFWAMPASATDMPVRLGAIAGVTAAAPKNTVIRVREAAWRLACHARHRVVAARHYHHGSVLAVVPAHRFTVAASRPATPVSVSRPVTHVARASEPAPRSLLQVASSEVRSSGFAVVLGVGF
jgi:hypothetical protein